MERQGAILFGVFAVFRGMIRDKDELNGLSNPHGNREDNGLSIDGERRRGFLHRLAFWGCPDGVRESRVVLPASDHVPMQVGHLVAKTSHIDLVRIQEFSHDGLNLKHHSHQIRALSACQIAHFFDVGTPDDTGEAGINGVLGVDDTPVWLGKQHR